MVAMLLPYFLCQEVESKSVFGQVKMLLMGEVQSVPKTVIGELMGRKGRVVKVC